jgi:hypothetical protein
MSNFLGIGEKYAQLFATLPNALFYTHIDIKSALLQNGSHHNVYTKGFDKYLLQIFLHNIDHKPLP